MNKHTLSTAFLTGIVLAFLQLPAHAQATRTWVSGVGDDANPCSRTAPCKTFAGAISKTAPGGEINVLDPGGFGAVTITKSMTIRSTFEAGVLVSGTNGIVISAGAGDTVILEGLDFEGLGTGLNGIQVSGPVHNVYVLRCSIHGFTTNAINMASTAAGAQLFVRDTVVNKNTAGINVSGPSNTATIINTMMDANTNFNLQVNGAGVSATVANSVLTGSGTAVNVINGGFAQSVGPSNVLTGGGSLSSTPFK